VETIAPGIHQIDTLLGGWDRVTAGFLVEGPSPALVETGSQTSVATVREALSAAGLGADDLRWLVLTHIHLDHAGGIGDLAVAFPRATVVVHERGARHLADPSRLLNSAALVYGPLLDSLYGRMLPVDPERIVAAADGHRVDVGDGRSLLLVDSPGHARHHHAVLDERTGTLLVGDAVGVRLPDVGVLRPAVPPPDFDLEAAIDSLHRFAALRPAQVVLTHYGPVPEPEATLAEAEEQLRRWVEIAERVIVADPRAGVDEIEAALEAEVAPSRGAFPEVRQDVAEAFNSIHSNAAGIERYLRKRLDRGASPP
jgi:glyoxylase-like metal-dependent hydrolase (beta-lactamase superfamily II)